MSRPSRAEEQQLERLELASMHLADAQIAAGILAVRVRQMTHRLAGCAELSAGAVAELTRIVDRCDAAHQMLGEELAQLQSVRTGKNRG
jgi:hypothetical protein